MSMVHVIRHVPDATVVVFERQPRSGPGPAYGACGPEHLLNVPAGRMGATADDPSGFVRWLHSVGVNVKTDEFVPRATYGRYLSSIVSDVVEANRSRVALVRDSVESVMPHANGCDVTLGSGRSIRSCAVVLALGLPSARPPSLPPSNGLHVIADPWSPKALDCVGGGDHVVILGTGLTALDVFVSLHERGHRGAITFVSKRGRFPLPHAGSGAASTSSAIDLANVMPGPRRALRELRRLARVRQDEAIAWQTVIDEFRPHIAGVWRSWSSSERARFLRHARALWEIHRHRAPQRVLDLVAAGKGEGRVRVLRGTIDRVRLAPDAKHLVNCIGPTVRATDLSDPLVQSLFASGIASTDSEQLGLRTDKDGTLVTADGDREGRMFVVGALRRGDLWESTAVPELREQVAVVGQAIVRTLAEAICDQDAVPVSGAR
jgi:uncharacterized NAD(P)/FAD-binding protein YdhS